VSPNLVPDDPRFDRFDAIAWSVVWAALGATAAVVTSVALDWTGSGAGWVLLALALPMAVLPLLRWRLRARPVRRLPVGHLDDTWRGIVARAAAATTRLEHLAASTPPGPVADHVATLTATAERHLQALHDAACGVAELEPTTRAVLWGDARRTAQRLEELAGAAEQLRDVQQRQLGLDPLGELVEVTAEFARALGAPALGAGDADPSLSARGADEPPGRAWPTTDR
jgi:hypothetical protein